MNIFRKSGPKIKYVEELERAFGNGASKKAFRIKVETPFLNKENYFTIPEEKDVADFCLVKFETQEDNHFIERRTLIFLTELEEFYKLSILNLAPALHQIRIDKVSASGKDVEKGVPFTPTELSAKKTEISNSKNYFTVSYLVEMCGEGVDAFLKKYPLKVAQVGEKFNEFAEKMVNKTGTANMDLKPANMCAKYNKTTGEIESISLLDVDPMFSISSETVDFRKHAKIFMNFLFFSFCLRYRKIKFPDWYLTKDDVEKMIRFFFAEEFTKNYHHPNSMLCYYLPQIKCPTESADLIIAALKDQINEIPETTSYKEGGGDPSKDSKEGGGDPSKDSKEEAVTGPDEKVTEVKTAVAGPIKDTTDNAPNKEEESKGGRRKRKSKKRKSNKKKHTRKA
jgi:hypothetical protein